MSSLGLRKYDEESTDFSIVLEKEPNNALALRLRGETYLKLGKCNEALTDFNKLLEIEPNNYLALRLRGETYQKFKNYNEALINFNKSLKSQPNNRNFHKEIIDKYSEILEIEPNNALALRLRGETYQKLKKYNEASTDFNKLLEFENNIHILRLRGSNYKILKKYKEALDDFNKILKINPDDISILNLIIETEKSKIQSITDSRSQEQQTESSELINWIPYSQFKNIKYIAEGGFGVVDSAIWIKDGENEIKVALKNLHNSKNMTDSFLKEVISHGITSSDDFIIQCYGITRDPDTNNNIMVMEFAEDGSLHNDLSRNFDEITWQKKLERLYCIAAGIEQIHNNNLIHRDLHSGNILMGVNGILGSIRIADLGLCRNIDNSTNYVYGIVPYVAPEIFEYSSYSRASDVYSFGMLMWEFTSGHKPFSNRPHNSKLICNISGGLRPKITVDTPEVFRVFMKRCWDSNPFNRPNMTEIREQFYKWCWGRENKEQFIRAENLRNISVELKLLGEREEDSYHPEAIYRSRPLNSIIGQFELMLIGRKESVSEVKSSHSSQADFEVNENDFQ
ncbi:hypothetical protein Glove_13g29 [Diversispora epigaea]|uniref:Protein kinase domain-containing protein n=1 Tax=Diversispora epigaea TaxID=1348612 RepID=A0A397JML2_9GLOM|nr:hypothetical protein Glove_13g29 [Diversispora epigaea]